MKQNLPEWFKPLYTNILTSMKFDLEQAPMFVAIGKNKKHKGIYFVSIAPLQQEVYGGQKDGKTEWCRFVFDIGLFVRQSGIKLHNYAVATPCKIHDAPRALMQFKWKNKKLTVQVL